MTAFPRLTVPLPRARGWFFPVAAAAFFYLGCGDSPTELSRTVVAASVVPASSTALSGTVGQPVSESPAVVVRDQNGDPMFGVAVTFAIATGGGSVSESPVFTDVEGVARVGSWTLGATAGTQSLTATVGSLTPVTFSATAQPGPAAAITKSAGDGQSAPAGSAVPVAPAVVVRDSFGNPVSGVAVTFAVASGGGSVTGPTAVTNNAGAATVGSWTLGTTAGANSLTATAGTLVTTFTATATAGAAVTMTKEAGDNQTATVSTLVPVLPSVRLTDAFGNPVSAVVTFTIASGNGRVLAGSIGAAVLSATEVTNANGVAEVRGWSLGPTVGTNTLTATVGSLSVTFTATGIAGAAASITKQAGDNQSAIVGTAVATPPAVRITDAQGNPLAGESVTFAVVSGSGSITGGTATTDANGVATVGSWTLGLSAGANTLVATSGSLSVTFTATGTPSPPANLVKNAGDGQIAIAGSPVAVAPAVRLTDTFDNPVVGATVTFAVASGGGSVGGATQVTNSDGVAVVGSWTLGTTAGPNTLTASHSGLSVTFDATGIAGAPANITKQAGDAQSATVGTAVAVDPTVRITDVNGNPVAGVSVQFAVASGGGSVTGGSATTDASGLAAVGSWTLGTAIGPNTLTATAGALVTTFTATATAGAPAAIEKLAGDGQTATVGTELPIDPSVRITDSFGNPVSGIAVTFSVSTGGGSVTGGTPLTNSDGVATVGSWTLGGAAGTQQLSVSAGAVSETFTATGTAGPAASIVAHLGNNQSATVGTEVAVDPTARVTDSFGNPVAGVSVLFEVLTGGGSITGANQVTDANGLATVGSWTLGTVAGANTLRASAGALNATFTATGTADVPANISISAGDGQTATVNTEVAIDPAVLITDQYGNPVPGVSVTFTPANGSVTGGTTSTGANGIATVGSWTLATIAGANSLTAAAGALSVGFTATGEAGPVETMSRFAGNNQTAPAGSILPIDPAVRLVDIFGNPVAGVQVTFTIVSPVGSDGIVTGATQMTNANGVATVESWQIDSTPGSNTLRASAAGLTADFTATGQ